jgi:hypothetical protein
MSITIGSDFTNIEKKEIEFNVMDSMSKEYKYIELEYNFSFPHIETYQNYIIVRLNEANLNKMDPGKPIIPVNLTKFNLPFGSKIVDVKYTHSNPLIFNISNPLAFGSKPVIDSYEISSEINIDSKIYMSKEPYPLDWISYHTGGGLSFGEHTTFFILRIYPVRYIPTENIIEFINEIKINVTYEEPVEPLIEDKEIYDLLILTPQIFTNNLEPLVKNKRNHGVKTILVELEFVYEELFWDGRDKVEKIKYFIKRAIEKWGIEYVLLVGGIKGQSLTWQFPVRYSKVVPPEEQEYPEESFISDLYFADIYNSQGKFSSWDSNNDNIFSVWNESFQEEMDMYPDVYIGRIPCRTKYEVKIMVNKIINYEKQKCSNYNWFKNLLLVAGDSYVDQGELNEGELISEAAIDLMPGFNPVRVYSSIDDINGKTVNNALNPGAGFAYFCGHGSDVSWNTHFPPANNTNWCTGYTVINMISLHNKEKLPVTIVGGCHNGKFDISVMDSIKNGLEKKGLRYFLPSSRFWYDGWATNCWAWWLTSKSNGGAIATIANTGLGTHGEDDSDNNGIADYLEVLDGWLELRFLELYGIENRDVLGVNHGQTITEYLHNFLGDNAKMDVKMVQQWQLFGDPSLRLGGYD